LLLPDKISRLIEIGVKNLTVTVNALEPEIGAQIYSHIEYRQKRLSGVEGAEVLINNQIQGIRKAILEGMSVKVNTVVIKGINDQHVPSIAKFYGDMGVYIQNLMPVIPQFKFDAKNRPSIQEIQQLREKCQKSLRQMTHCHHCRSDAAGLLNSGGTCFSPKSSLTEKKE